MIWKLLLALLAGTSGVDESAPGPAVIVRDGQFHLRESGAAFRPVGFNYIRLFDEAKTADHDNFSRTGYDAAGHEAMLRRLASRHFNTVRVFVNFQSGQVIDGRDDVELSADYLDNVADCLGLARKHGVYVMLSMRRHPEIRRYVQLRGEAHPLVTGGNQESLHPGWILAKTQYLTDFLTEVARRDARALESIFAIDIQNEVCFYPGQRPFSLDEGQFTDSRGRIYDLASDKQRLADDAAIAHVNVCAEAIHKIFPGVLVNVNVFTYAAVGRSGPGDFHVDKAQWRNRVPFRPLAIVRSKADMVDVHLYSGSLADYQRDLESIEFERVRKAAAAMGKPLIVGEFGIFKQRFDNDFSAACQFLENEWLPALRRDWDGLLYWTYDTHEQPRLFHADFRDSTIFSILASE